MSQAQNKPATDCTMNHIWVLYV